MGVAVRHNISHRALERPNELPPDDLAFAFGVGDTGQRLQEPVRGVDGDQVGAGGSDEVALHLRALAGPQQAVVDEDAGQSVADGALHQRRGHRGVDSAGQPADRPAVTDLVAHLLDQRVGDIGGRPRRTDTGELVQEPAEHLLAVRRMQHLGVVLHTCQPAGPILERRHRGARAGGHHLEPVRRGGDRVTVAHPHRLGGGQIGMQLPANDIQFGPAVLAGAGVGHGSAERLGHRLEAVADAEHRQRRGRTAPDPAAGRRRRRHWPGRRTARWPAGPWP